MELNAISDLLLSIDINSGKVRLAKWFTTMAPKAKAKIVKDVTQLVLARRTRMCNFLEYKGWWLRTLTRANMEVEALGRFQGGLQTICITLFRVRNWIIG